MARVEVDFKAPGFELEDLNGLFKLGRMPAQMLIDKSGILRFVHYGGSMADIPPNTEILELFRG